MKTNFKVMIGTTAIAVTIAGLAWATPIVDLTSPLLAVGQHPGDIATSGSGHTKDGKYFQVVVKSEGPATVSTQDAAFTLDGINGWHSHPGMVAVTLIFGLDRVV